MIHKKTKQVPATTVEIIEKTTCDLCGEIIQEEMFEVNKVNVSQRVGRSYPEGGSGINRQFDICGKCFNEKIVTWLESQGAKPRIEDWDW